MSASERFERLAVQIDQAVAEVKTAASQDKAKLQANVDAARKKADEQSAQMRAPRRRPRRAPSRVGSRSRAIGMRTPGRFGSAWIRDGEARPQGRRV